MGNEKVRFLTNIKFLLQYMKGYKIPFINFYMGMLFNSITDMISPILLGLLINEVLYYKNMDTFINLALMYSLLIIYQCLNQLVSYHSQHYLNSVYVLKIRHKLFKRILAAKPSFLCNMKSGILATVVDEYTDYCLHFIVRNFFHFFNNIIVLLWCTFYIFRVDLLFGFSISIVVVVQVLCMIYSNRAVKEVSNVQQELYGSHLGFLTSMLESLRDIQLLSVTEYICGKLKKNYYQYKEKETAVVQKKFYITQLIDFFNLILLLVIYAMAALFVYHGKIQLGTFLVIITYYNTLADRILKTANALNFMGENVSKIDSIRTAFMEETEEEEWGKTKVSDLAGSIEFQGISFSYGNTKVLNDVNFCIGYGTKLGIAGESGSGKSTLVSLLLGFYPVSKGRIEINHHDIREIDLKSLRKDVGVVHQEILVYQDTIRNNLLIAKPNASEHELEAAVKAACLDKLVEQLPEGLDTVITRNGRNISGGQLQRIAIARLFLKESNIIICDEATSALDTYTEHDIMKSISNAFCKKTVISISHRLNTLLECEKVIVLKDGNIVQYGDPKTLIHEQGEFYNLFYSQEKRIDDVREGV